MGIFDFSKKKRLKKEQERLEQERLQKEHLRKLGLSEAQIAKIEAETEYIQGAKTDKTVADTELVKEKIKTEPVKRDVMKNPPVHKYVSTKNGHTVVDINHHGGSGKQKSKSTTPKPKSGDYYF